MTTTSDARKRHAETQEAEKLCRLLHPLEWRDDNHGRTAPCPNCQRHTEAFLAGGGPPLRFAVGLHPNGCIDMEDYARIYNEGYTRAQRHAHDLVRDLPTRVVATDPLVPSGGGQLLSEHVVRRADLLAAFPAIPMDDEPEDGHQHSYEVEEFVCPACAEKASNQ